MTVLQSSLLSIGFTGVNEDSRSQRTWLDSTSWVDLWPQWFGGSDDLYESLAENVRWRQRKRWMYDRLLDEPRLTRWYRSSDKLPHGSLHPMRQRIGTIYGVPFGAMGLNYYRDGSDSVAFHRDKELRYLQETVVAIVTFGATRPFLLRPVGGGRSRRFLPSSGDLLVMGGACQVHFEHAVPKVTASGPRISASVRWSSKNGPVTALPKRSKAEIRS